MTRITGAPLTTSERLGGGLGDACSRCWAKLDVLASPMQRSACDPGQGRVSADVLSRWLSDGAQLAK